MRSGHHSWERVGAFNDALEKGDLLRRRCVLRVRQRHPHGQDVVRVVAGRVREQPQKLRNMSPPPTRSMTCERHLPDDEQARRRCGVRPASMFGLLFNAALTSCFHARNAGPTP